MNRNLPDYTEHEEADLSMWFHAFEGTEQATVYREALKEMKAMRKAGKTPLCRIWRKSRKAHPRFPDYACVEVVEAPPVAFRPRTRPATEAFRVRTRK